MEIADKSAWYEKRRNELLALLEETTKLEIPESLADELKAIRTKCLENQFEIGLVGEFQGGKSTTFNALCDGRDLSPRGLGGGGIKTSAALVSAQNIAGDEKRDGMSEWAEITFKTKFQIQQGMFDLVKSELLEDESFRKLFPDLSDEKFDQQMMSADVFAATFDLDNAGHRQRAPVHRFLARRGLATVQPGTGHPDIFALCGSGGQRQTGRPAQGL